MTGFKYVEGEHPVTEVMEDTAYPAKGNPDYLVVNSLDKDLFVVFPSKSVDNGYFKRGTEVYMFQGNYDDVEDDLSSLINTAGDNDDASVMHVASRMPVQNVIWGITSPVR